jgi:hypothetical protein
MSDLSDEETNEPLLADHRNFYKVEKWTKEGRVERMLYAGSNLDKAREVFTAAIVFFVAAGLAICLSAALVMRY